MKTQGDISGNIGEWSELYALLKLLADGQIQAGDGHLNPLPNAVLPIIAITRHVGQSSTTYLLQNGQVSLLEHPNSAISREQCQQWAQQLLLALQTQANTTGARTIPQGSDWMKALHTTQLKAASLDKSDIELEMHDLRTGGHPKLGFSIKSRLGAPSSLLNSAGDNTNLIYELNHIELKDCALFHKERLFRQAFSALPTQYGIACVGFAKPTFENNLRMVDEALPSILGQLLFLYYQGQHGAKIATLCQELAKLNPQHFDLNLYPDYYNHKVKRLLVDIALGFTPSKPWTGQYQATGGYIVVKETGDLVSYHVYERNAFEDYLFMNTQFDTPSKQRHHFGQIEHVDGRFLLKLNLQIRFFH